MRKLRFMLVWLWLSVQHVNILSIYSIIASLVLVIHSNFMPPKHISATLQINGSHTFWRLVHGRANVFLLFTFSGLHIMSSFYAIVNSLFLGFTNIRITCNMFWTQDSQNSVDFNRPKPHKDHYTKMMQTQRMTRILFANNYLTVSVWKSVHFRSTQKLSRLNLCLSYKYLTFLLLFCGVSENRNLSAYKSQLLHPLSYTDVRMERVNVYQVLSQTVFCGISIWCGECKGLLIFFTPLKNIFSYANR
jgi:hypothetical protein